MAESEDTELRDLVIESLEKNGSLAKIRALLRANIFLAFEDECTNSKQNESLDRILKIPEGKISLCIIHEFLEFCNLKNTLFVYTSETRQGKEYNYEKVVAEKLNVPKSNKDKEPVLLSIVKNIIKPCQNNHFSPRHNSTKDKAVAEKFIKDDQNCTYIVHEDTSTTSSQSQSDISSDEKNKIDLRLPLNNSDTDTSSESVNDKNTSEYTPNKQNFISNTTDKHNLLQNSQKLERQNNNSYNMWDKKENVSMYDSKPQPNSSTDSTSYMELKPLNPVDEVLHNTTGLPIVESPFNLKTYTQSYSSASQNDSISSMHGSSNTDPSNKENICGQRIEKCLKTSNDMGKNDTDTMEYSYDFSPPNSEHVKSSESKLGRSQFDNNKNTSKAITLEQHSPSSQSSVSISDVADLISEKNDSTHSNKTNNESCNSNNVRLGNKSNSSLNKAQLKAISDDSGDFSESSVPSLSNLSLDIHSD